MISVTEHAPLFSQWINAVLSRRSPALEAAAVAAAVASLRCHLQPQWLPLRWAAAPHCWDRVVRFPHPLHPPVCRLGVSEAINKPCSFMVRSCVAQ